MCKVQMTDSEPLIYNRCQVACPEDITLTGAVDSRSTGPVLTLISCPERCWPCRLSQTGADFDLMSRALLALNRLVQCIESFSPQLVTRKANGGERRLSELAKLNVIEANNGDIIGDTQTSACDGTERPDSGQVVGGEYRGWRLGQ